MQEVPYQLEKGLLLENSETLLPWFKSLNQITKLHGKPFPIKGKTTQLVWESESVLGGLNVSIQAMERGLGMYFLTPKEPPSFSSVQDEYAAISKELKIRLGEPHITGETEGYPWQRWMWGEVCVSLALAERFMEYVALSVSKGVIAK